MRSIPRCFLVLVLLTLAVGPAFAAPLHVSAGPSVQAPASHVPDAVGSVFKVLAVGASAFGAITIKDTGTLAKKFVRNASAAGGDYTTGVQAAGASWQAGASAAGDNYAAGTQAAIADKRFEKGVANSSAKFVQRASTLGAQRYPTGIAAAEGAWATGVQPSLDTLKSLTLPPRRPKGDPGNMARSNAVATALRAQKVGR